MWSVWRNSIDVYLARGFAAVMGPQNKVQTVSLPTMVPLSHLLDGLTAYLPRRARLRIALSAAIARPFSIAVPKGLKSSAEVAPLIEAALTKDWGEAAGTFNACLDLGTQGLAGVIAKETLGQLHQWAAGAGCSVASISPVWAMASQLQWVRRRLVKGFVLQEPDGLSWISEPGAIKGIAWDNACTRLVGFDLSNWRDAPGLSQADNLVNLSCAVAFRPTATPLPTDQVFRGEAWESAWRQA